MREYNSHEVDENFFYQQKMEYVRSFISARDLKDDTMSSGQRSMLMNQLEQFDEDLEYYFQTYKVVKKQIVEEIDSSKYDEVFAENQEKLKIDGNLRTYVLWYYNEILVYLYTYSYIQHLEFDYSAISRISIESVIKRILSGEIFPNMHVIRSTDDSKKRALITFVDNISGKEQKELLKRLAMPKERGHIYR